MLPIFGQNDHFSRCLRLDAIDWSHRPRSSEQSAPIAIGGTVLDVVNLKKYYQVAASQIFGGREARTVKAVEDVSFVANEAETVAIVGESGCGKSTLAKVLLGPGDRDRRHGFVRSSRHSGHRDRAARRQDDRAPFR